MAFYQDRLKAHSKIEIKERLKRIKNNADSIVELDLNFLDLTDIPKELKELRNLKVLYLNENEITQIDSELFEGLVSLRELHLFGNKITEIPASISKLSNLQVLELTANPIKQLPENLFKLTHLKTLALRSTEIHQLPDEIFQLVNLAHLELPDSIALFKIKNWDLIALKQLYISYDLLVYNHHIIDKLQNLDQLYIRYDCRSNDSRGHRENSNTIFKEEYFKKLLPKVKIHVSCR
jgi:Leucine-rich repeat (LRR) protein